jgi:hypothetical protein
VSDEFSCWLSCAPSFVAGYRGSLIALPARHRDQAEKERPPVGPAAKVVQVCTLWQLDWSPASAECGTEALGGFSASPVAVEDAKNDPCAS